MSSSYTQAAHRRFSPTRAHSVSELAKPNHQGWVGLWLIAGSAAQGLVSAAWGQKRLLTVNKHRSEVDPGLREANQLIYFVNLADSRGPNRRRSGSHLNEFPHATSKRCGNPSRVPLRCLFTSTHRSAQTKLRWKSSSGASMCVCHTPLAGRWRAIRVAIGRLDLLHNRMSAPCAHTARFVGSTSARRSR